EERSYNGYTPFEISEKPDRELYAPVTYVESPGAKKDILGYDFAAVAEMMRAARAALLSTQPHMTEPIMMPHADGGASKDVFIISAVKSYGNMGLRSYLGPNEDRTLFVAAGFSPSIALSEIIKQAAMGARFNLRIVDTTDTEPKLIFGTADAPQGVAPLKTDQVVLGNRVWALDYYPLHAATGLRNQQRSILLGVIGIALILALTIAIDRLIKSRSQLEGDVRERTEQLHSLNKVLAAAAQQANAENDAKSMFLAHMSHELRTPLNAVIGYAQMLKKETFGALGDQRYLDYAATIEEAGNIQLRLVEDILSLTALQGGSRELDMQPLNLRAVAEKCVMLLQTRFEAKGLTVKVISLMGA
ncbi:MAG: histidine kinase dimerization/phospho-acceptor domain-containing protein, partial [Rhodospirillales bacterium]